MELTRRPSARQAGRVLEFEITQRGETRSVQLEKDEVVIGRRNEMRQVHLDLSPDDLVSRVHARVWQEENSVLIEDLGSSGGTQVNDRRITGPTELQPNAEVKLGSTLMTIVNPEAKPKKRTRRKKPGKGRPTRPQPRQPEGEPEEAGEPTASGPAESAPSAISAEITVDGETERRSFADEEIRIGREHPGGDIHLDLSADLLVSRNHARVWQTRGICWVEDLGSTHGTRVNGAVINGACVIQPTDEVQIGSIVLCFWVDTAPQAPAKKKRPPKKKAQAFPPLESYPVFKEETYTYHPPENRSPDELEEAILSRKSPMGRIRSTHELTLSKPFQSGKDAKSLLDLLPDFPRQLNAHPDSAAMAKWIVNQLKDNLDGAERAALFIIDLDTSRIRPLAHAPALKPILSDQLAHRALHKRTAFAWQQVSKKESVRRLSMHAGMYVPLISSKDEVGILCVENTAEHSEFSETQLSVLSVVGQLVAVFMQNRLWREAAVEEDE